MSILALKARAYLKALLGYPEAGRQLARVRRLPRSPYAARPRAGYLRGIDFYSPTALTRVLAECLYRYKRVHGVYPDLVNPRGLNEKIFWWKFFGEMKVPEAGNKLLTSRFIPDGARPVLNCPEIVWHSATARLPKNHELSPGVYYMKANHGSQMFRRIEYPLRDDEFPGLEALCDRWLGNPFGLKDGQWWYNVFPKEILIEKSVVTEPEPVAWDFYVINGALGYIVLFRKRESDHESTWLDGNFEPLAWQNERRPRVSHYSIPACADQMKHLALQIGRQFEFARVDFLLGEDGRPYLGEVTFSPSNAHLRRPREFDILLGDMWKTLGGTHAN